MTARVFLLAGFAAITLAIFYVLKVRSVSEIVPSSPPSKTEHLTIADAPYPAFALLFIAETKGYFKEENLEITYRHFSLGKEALKDVVAGNSDLATVYETPFIRTILAGENIAAISSLHKSTKSTALFTLRKNKISTAADLKRKRVGVIKGTNGEFFLYSLLQGAGIRESEITIVDLDVAKLPDALAKGTVDAIVIFSPTINTLKRQYGDNGIILYSDLYIENSVLAGKLPVITQKSEAIKRLLRAMTKASAFAKANRQEAIASIAESINSTPEDLQDIWGDYTFTLDLDNIFLTIANREKEWMRSSSPNSPGIQSDMRHYIFTDYLKEIDPKAATLF